MTSPIVEQAHFDQDFDMDLTYGEERDEVGYVDFGFDNAELAQEDNGPVGAFDCPPSPMAGPSPHEEAQYEIDEGPTSASAATVVTLEGTGGAAAATPIVVANGVKRRRLSAKTSPAKAAELGHVAGHAEELDDEGLVTQSAAAAARLRNRGLLATHRQKAKAARLRAWDAFSRQPERDSVGDLGTNAADEGQVDAAQDAPAHLPVVPRCWDAHCSHDIAAPTRSLLFCRRCAAWSSGHRTRGLAAACRGAVGHRGSLRFCPSELRP